MPACARVWYADIARRGFGIWMACGSVWVWGLPGVRGCGIWMARVRGGRGGENPYPARVPVPPSCITYKIKNRSPFYLAMLPVLFCCLFDDCFLLCCCW